MILQQSEKRLGYYIVLKSRRFDSWLFFILQILSIRIKKLFLLHYISAEVG
jgi:hypothetical protein